MIFIPTPLMKHLPVGKMKQFDFARQCDCCKHYKEHLKISNNVAWISDPGLSSYELVIITFT